MRVIDSPDYMGGGIFYREHEKYMHDPELREAYECGKKHGWREAMEEAERHYGERRTYPPMYREGGGRDGGMNYRDEDYDSYDERRRRDSRGRYI